MTAQGIYVALQSFKGGDAEQKAAAKAGFLQWALTLPCSSSAAQEACSALMQLGEYASRSQKTTGAAGHFIVHLRDASRRLPHPTRRGGAQARRRVLH